MEVAVLQRAWNSESLLYIRWFNTPIYALLGCITGIECGLLIGGKRAETEVSWMHAMHVDMFISIFVQSLHVINNVECVLNGKSQFYVIWYPISASARTSKNIMCTIYTTTAFLQEFSHLLHIIIIIHSQITMTWVLFNLSNRVNGHERQLMVCI